MIKLKSVHPTNKDQDTMIALHPDRIIYIQAASRVDRNQRAEINSIIYLIGGIGLAVVESIATITTMIENAEKDFPSED